MDVVIANFKQHNLWKEMPNDYNQKQLEVQRDLDAGKYKVS